MLPCIATSLLGLANEKVEDVRQMFFTHVPMRALSYAKPNRVDSSGKRQRDRKASGSSSVRGAQFCKAQSKPKLHHWEDAEIAPLQIFKHGKRYAVSQHEVKAALQEETTWGRVCITEVWN